MKVDYDMAERLVLELHARGVHAMGWNDAVYGALKATIADLPEPGDTVPKLNARIHAHQVALEQVRAWADKAELLARDRMLLEDILRGDDKP